MKVSTKSSLPASYVFIAWLTLPPWRWKRLVPPKRLLTFNGLHGIASHKIEIFLPFAPLFFLNSFLYFSFPFAYLFLQYDLLELSICLYSQIWRYWIFIKSDQWFEYKSAPIRCWAHMLTSLECIRLSTPLFCCTGYKCCSISSLMKQTVLNWMKITLHVYKQQHR
jgi:hypothetical protein